MKNKLSKFFSLAMLMSCLTGFAVGCGEVASTTVTPTTTATPTTTVAPTSTVKPTTTGTPTTTIAPTSTVKPTTAAPTTATPTISDIVSLKVEGERIVDGTEFASHKLKVIAVNKNGEEAELSEDKYDIALPTETKAKLGVKYEAKVTLKENPSISKTFVYEVVTRLQGEHGKSVNGKVVTEPEYVFDGENFILGEDVTSVGGFAKSVNSDKEGSVSLSFNSKTNSNAELTIRMSNSNLQSTEDGYYFMEDLQMNTIIDISVNGSNIDIGDDVIIPGTPIYSLEKAYAPLYGIYHNITFDNINLKAGINDIKISFKKSTINGLNHWKESPSEGNIDYLDICTVGSTISNDISSIRVDEKFVPNYGTKIADTVVIGTSGNTDIMLDNSQVTIVDIEDENNEYYIFKNNKIKVSLNDNSAINCDWTYEIAKTYSSVIKWEDIELDEANSKVYWVFEFENRGYEASQYKLFDGTFTFVPTIIETTLLTIKFKIDISDYSAKTYYPHAEYTVDGVTTKYFAHKNGDLLVNATQYNANATASLNGKNYSLKLEWGMANLVVA